MDGDGWRWMKMDEGIFLINKKGIGESCSIFENMSYNKTIPKK
jgi:hypothetical protein